MEVALLPQEKIIFRTRKKIAIGGSITLEILLLAALFFTEMKIIGLETIFFLTFGLFLWYPTIRYGRISQSDVVFSQNTIDFKDSKGNCWRSVPYSSITTVRKMIVPGTLYGEKKDEVEREHLCIFLNDTEEIPDVSYHRLFTHPDFTMIYYRDEIFHTLTEHGIPCTNSES